MNVENGAHFLNATSVLLPAVTVISPVTKKNVSKQSQRLDLILSLSNFIELFRFYWCFAVWLSIIYLFFFVVNLDSSLLASFNEFIIFCVPVLYDTHRISWKIKNCFYWFLNNEKYFAPLSSSSLPIKLIFCFKSEFSNSICLLKSIAISL